MPILGHFLVIVSPIIGLPCLSRVIMDGTSGLNNLYADTLDRMKILRSRLRPSEVPFYRIIAGLQVVPLGSTQLLITSGEPTNFHKELITIKVVAFMGTYHALLTLATQSSWVSCTTPA